MIFTFLEVSRGMRAQHRGKFTAQPTNRDERADGKCDVFVVGKDKTAGFFASLENACNQTDESRETQRAGAKNIGERE